MGSATGGCGGPLLDSADAPAAQVLSRDHRTPPGAPAPAPRPAASMPVILFLLLLLPVCAGLAFGLTGYGIGALARSRRSSRRTGSLLGALAAFCGAASAVVYAWGGLLLAGAVVEAEDGGTSSSPLLPCRDVTGREEQLQQVVGYSVGFVPLRFDCELTDGGSYDSGAVPGAVSAHAATLALSGAALAVAARYAAEREARSRSRTEAGGPDRDAGSDGDRNRS
ncbi:hypothetical protein [Streptomyces sp. SID5473]|nr:hypothetical protein [Streptomyces sp. SID5473]EIF88328.1 hypothetical protein [Streptomyces tsukubensis NRRL18488]